MKVDSVVESFSVSILLKGVSDSGRMDQLTKALGMQCGQNWTL